MSGFADDLYFYNPSFGPGFTGPGSFGSGGTTNPSGGTGSDFLFDANNSLALPEGYLSGTSFTDSSTYSGATFSSLGITPGAYTWTWAQGADSLVLNVVVPDPASFTLLGTGILGMMAIRRRRRAP